MLQSTFTKVRLKVFFAVIFIGGLLCGFSGINPVSSAQSRQIPRGGNSNPPILQQFGTQLNGAELNQNTPAGQSNYTIFENQTKRFSVYIFSVNLPDGTNLAVELDNVVVGQITLNSRQGNVTIESPANVPAAVQNSTLKLKNGANVVAEGVFEEVIPRPQILYSAEGTGAKVVPAVNSPGELIAFAGQDVETGVVQFTVVGFNLQSRPTSITIHGPATTTQNAPILFTLEPLFVFPDASNPNIFTVVASSVEFPFNPAQLALLADNRVYVRIATEGNPNGEVRGQFELYSTPGDFEGDGRADFSVFRPDNGNWYFLNSSNDQFRVKQFGGANDKIVPGDFDGDGVNDLAFFEKSGGFGYWNVKCSVDNANARIQWGLATDIPLVADFDRDNRPELTVFRPSNGTWYRRRAGDVIKPRNGQIVNNDDFPAIQWGQNGDLPIAADYDGDDIADLTVFRPSNGIWYIRRSSDGNFQGVQWGQNGDVPIKGDFDGDRIADIAVYRPSNGTWYVRQSDTGQNTTVRFGISGDIPTAADFDGDGIADYSVFRPSNGTWYGLKSSNNYEFFARQFGQNGDIPTLAP